ncbi:hypothetical protein VIGAN_08220100 [Vigna angularis var. angularis]|uniref:Uncharacterized protein n=1 Tax=Vigna angularis var. angularis TaxID=157739 RepID=A0A0S3SRL3_PHAAN|nr:hypothetical protein VIGAN_08220100 [Vigna angularis var. angularis]
MSSCTSCSFSSFLLLVNPPPRASHNYIRGSLRMSLNNDNNNSNFTSSSLLNSVTKLLWGHSLPPGILVASVRMAWNSAWGLMMS